MLGVVVCVWLFCGVRVSGLLVPLPPPPPPPQAVKASDNAIARVFNLNDVIKCFSQIWLKLLITQHSVNFLDYR